jgi:hypothetical protein
MNGYCENTCPVGYTWCDKEQKCKPPAVINIPLTFESDPVITGNSFYDVSNPSNQNYLHCMPVDPTLAESTVSF